MDSFQNHLNNKKNPNVAMNSDNVFRIFIQRSFKQLIDLPEPTIWSDTLLNTLQSRLLIQIVRYGFFFNSETDYLPLHCVITRRGYLIIYTKESSLKGHAVKLFNAKKIQISSSRVEKGFSEITIKWSFGEIKFLLFKTQYDEWGARLLQGFDGIDVSTTSDSLQKPKKCNMTTQTDHYDYTQNTSSSTDNNAQSIHTTREESLPEPKWIPYSHGIFDCYIGIGGNKSIPLRDFIDTAKVVFSSNGSIYQKVKEAILGKQSNLEGSEFCTRNSRESSENLTNFPSRESSSPKAICGPKPLKAILPPSDDSCKVITDEKPNVFECISWYDPYSVFVQLQNQLHLSPFVISQQNFPSMVPQQTLPKEQTSVVLEERSISAVPQQEAAKQQHDLMVSLQQKEEKASTSSSIPAVSSSTAHTLRPIKSSFHDKSDLKLGKQVSFFPRENLKPIEKPPMNLDGFNIFKRYGFEQQDAAPVDENDKLKCEKNVDSEKENLAFMGILQDYQIESDELHDDVASPTSQMDSSIFASSTSAPATFSELEPEKYFAEEHVFPMKPEPINIVSFPQDSSTSFLEQNICDNLISLTTSSKFDKKFGRFGSVGRTVCFDSNNISSEDDRSIKDPFACVQKSFLQNTTKKPLVTEPKNIQKAKSEANYWRRRFFESNV